jgi:hypothetical protein
MNAFGLIWNLMDLKITSIKSKISNTYSVFSKKDFKNPTSSKKESNLSMPINVPYPLHFLNYFLQKYEHLAYNLGIKIPEGVICHLF